MNTRTEYFYNGDYEEDEPDIEWDMTAGDGIIRNVERRGFYNRIPVVSDDTILTADKHGHMVNVYHGEWRW
jgi:hypothetical protein